MSTHLSLTGLSPSLAGFPKTVLLNLLNQLCGPNPGMHASRFGLFRFRSPLLTESHVVFSSSGYLDVSVHRVPFLTLWIGVRIPEVCSGRFPHSEISGSMGICPSPKLSQLITSSSALSAKASTIRSYQHNQLDLIPREWDNVHTCIALHALVIVNFFLNLFSSDLKLMLLTLPRMS